MERLTFLAVHAHPDDEASSTGGLLPLLADQGVRTVLVTCTNGECGDAPDGVKPDAEHHDGDEVAAIRAIELDSAVEVARHRRAGATRVPRLGDDGLAPERRPASPSGRRPSRSRRRAWREVLTRRAAPGRR